MRISTLLCFSLLALTASSQTKEAEFKKIENLLKKTKGMAAGDLKIVDQTFTEKSVKIDIAAEGKSGASAYSGLDWDGFSYSVDKLKGDEDLSTVVISFEEEVDMTVFENKKQVEKFKEEEMELVVKTEDAALLKQYLKELQTYTWKSLIELRTADKEGLTHYLTKTLNTVLEDDGGEIKSINECEITVDYGDEEVTMPTKKLTLHTKEFISTTYLFCYGKGKGAIQTKNEKGRQASSVEHPEIEMEFEDNEDSVEPVAYAIRRLAAICKS